VNNNLAETWRERADEIDPAGLLARREPYEAEPLPAGVVLLTAGVDVQDDRLEVEIVGWGRDEENWSIDYLVLSGEPALPAIWDDLDEVLRRRFEHPVGEKLPIFAAAVDSGGHHTQAVYAFCAARRGRRVWAVKGIAGEGRRIFDRPRQTKAQGRMYPVGVDTAKTRIYARLLTGRQEVEEEGTSGYCHFPDRYTREYFDQLTAEKIVTKYVHGRPKRIWILPPNRSNEALDCRVYNVAALESVLSVVSLNSLATRMEQRLKELKEPAAKSVQREQPPRRSWVNRY
jgi:phage terminase large subunit GpA-like protein